MPRRRAADPINAEVMRDLLVLVGIEVSAEEVGGWTPQQRDEIEAWAGAHYLAASDNPVRVPPRPSWFRPPDKRKGGET